MDIKEFLADFVADEQEKNTSPKDYEEMEKVVQGTERCDHCTACFSGK